MLIKLVLESLECIGVAPVRFKLLRSPGNLVLHPSQRLAFCGICNRRQEIPRSLTRRAVPALVFEILFGHGRRSKVDFATLIEDYSFVEEVINGLGGLVGSDCVSGSP